MTNKKTPKRRRNNSVGNFLTREAFLAVPLKIEEMYIEELGGSIRIKEMTAKQLQDSGSFVLRPDGKVDIKRAVQVPVRACLEQVVDEAGNRLFTDADIYKMEQMPGGVITKIADRVRRLAGQGGEDDAANLSNWLKEKHPDVFADLSRWLEENYPDVAMEFRGGKGGPVEVAKERFLVIEGAGNGASHSA